MLPFEKYEIDNYPAIKLIFTENRRIPILRNRNKYRKQVVSIQNHAILFP